MVTAAAAKEAIWLEKLLSDIECPDEFCVTVFVDNQSTIKLANNPEYHKRTKHIDTRYHFLHEKCESGKIILKDISSECNKADILTKVLPRDRFCRMRECLN